jgi:hypothetical protein
VAEYAVDVSNHMLAIEKDHIPSLGYMHTQNDINEKMRAILIDWLIEVHLKFKLLPETLFRTVNMLDRYLSKEVIPRTKL